MAERERPWQPGPWFVAPARRADGLAEIEDGRDHGLFPIVCEWGEANLIAAAPELFEALTDLFKFVEGHMHFAQPAPDMGEEPSDEFTYDACLVASVVRAALAKAEGKEPTK